MSENRYFDMNCCSFLKFIVVVGVLVLGIYFMGSVLCVMVGVLVKLVENVKCVNLFIVLCFDGMVEVICYCSEMGQQICIVIV